MADDLTNAKAFARLIPRGRAVESLSLVEVAVLWAVHEHGARPSIGDLMRILDMPRATVSEAVTRLHNLNYVGHYADPTDRRRMLVWSLPKTYRLLRGRGLS